MLQRDCIESILLDVKDWTVWLAAKSNVKAQGCLRTGVFRDSKAFHRVDPPKGLVPNSPFGR
jgi:hypothetical protein